MAPLSPGIPTSFVPKQSAPDRRPSASGRNIFLLASLFIGGLALIATAGTYAYDRYLTLQLASRAQELAVAQQSVNKDQVEEFLRLRDRLSYGQNLLDSHVALSQVLDTLETETLTTVRYQTLSLHVANDHTAELLISGTARNFNALAAQSNGFAADKRIRRAIFSGITVNKDNSVNFKLTADLDSKLILSQKTTAPETLPQTGLQQQPSLPAAGAIPGATTTPVTNGTATTTL